MNARKLARDKTLEGGRSLEAIWNCQNLNRNQVLILQRLTSKLNYGGDFREWRWMSIRSLAADTKMSPRTILRELKSLETSGYLDRRQRFDDRGKAPSAYRLTNKIFAEYDQLLADLSKNPKPRFRVVAEDGPEESPDDTLQSGDNGGNLPDQNTPTCHEVHANPAPTHVTTRHISSSPRAPSEAPPFTARSAPHPKNVIDLDENVGWLRTKRQRQNDISKARTALVSCMSFSPGKFIPYDVIKADSEKMLDRFGLEPIEAFKNYVAREFGLQRLNEWNEPLFNSWMVEYQEGKHRGCQGEQS